MTIRTKSTRLTANSGFGDIVVAYGFANRKQVNYAREIRQSELDSITPRDMRAGRRARMLGEVLQDMGLLREGQVEFCLRVQRILQR